MDKKAANEFLNFLGAETNSPRPPSWDLRQLRYARLSFSISGEDMVLLKLLRPQVISGERGTFADIGAFAPCSISNTYLLYCLGWRGIAVDANPGMAAQWAEARPKDVFVHAAVGERDDRAYWFRYPNNVGMSAISASPVAPTVEHDQTPVEVPMRRLDAIFAEHIGDRQFDLLCMDIEGTELPALKSN